MVEVSERSFEEAYRAGQAKSSQGTMSLFRPDGIQPHVAH